MEITDPCLVTRWLFVYLLIVYHQPSVRERAEHREDMKLLYLIFILTIPSLEAQLISNIKDWWSSFRTYDDSTEPPPAGPQVSVIKYGEWTSAPRQTPDIVLTTPTTAQDARNIEVERKVSASTESGNTSTGSLFDLMSPPVEVRDSQIEISKKSSPPPSPSTSTLTSTSTSTSSTSARPTSLFDVTEIFFQNFSLPYTDVKSQEFKPLFLATPNKTQSMKDRLPKIPEKFKEVLSNHTKAESASLFDSGSALDNMFSVSRPSGDIDPSLIVDSQTPQEARTLEGGDDTDLQGDTNSRFGLSRPKIRGLMLKEIERSSKPSSLTIKKFKNHKYDFLKNKRKKEMNIEQILDASNARKRFDLSKRIKPKSPIYVKRHKGMSTFRAEEDHEDMTKIRNARQQDREWRGMLPFPFKTGTIFDSKTGEISHFDLGRSLQLPKEEEDDEEIIEQHNKTIQSDLQLAVEVDDVGQENVSEAQTSDELQTGSEEIEIFPVMETNGESTELPQEESNTETPADGFMEEDFLSGDEEVSEMIDDSVDVTTVPTIQISSDFSQEGNTKSEVPVSRFRLPAAPAEGLLDPRYKLVPSYVPGRPPRPLLSGHLVHPVQHPVHPVHQVHPVHAGLHRLVFPPLPRLTGYYPRLAAPVPRGPGVPLYNNFGRILYV